MEMIVVVAEATEGPEKSSNELSLMEAIVVVAEATEGPEKSSNELSLMEAIVVVAEATEGPEKSSNELSLMEAIVVVAEATEGPENNNNKLVVAVDVGAEDKTCTANTASITAIESEKKNEKKKTIESEKKNEKKKTIESERKNEKKKTIESEMKNEKKEKKNRIQVSNTKKPFFFYLNLAKKYIQEYNNVELSALGMAIPTVVTISEILKRNGLATQKEIVTSSISSKDAEKGRLAQIAKIEIVLEKADKLDKTTVDIEKKLLNVDLNA